MEEGILAKTGKSIKHWIDVVRASKIEKHKGIIDYLKSEHGFTYGYANFVAHKVRKSDAGSHDDEDLVKNQYAGKEVLKPIYDKLLEAIESFGQDITKTPKKDSVSLIRKRQFALIKPATKTRVDLGLKLKGEPVAGRLGSSGPFGTMCTHRIQLSAVEEVDDEVRGWLKKAYDMSV